MKWMTLLFVFLLSFSVYSGVKTVYYAHEQSEFVAQIQELKNNRDQINAEWTQLLLEEKTLSNAALIEHELASGIDLHLPKAKQVVFLD